MKTYYYGHKLYTRGKPLATHMDWLRRYKFFVVSLSPAYPEHLRQLGERSIHIPLPDGQLNDKVIKDVLRAKEYVVEHAGNSEPVLTHCNAGRNRAALVTGLAYSDLAQVSGRDALEHVRGTRPNSLANDHFVQFLEQYRPHRTLAALHQMMTIKPLSSKS